ncbi:ribonuclease J [Convivina intestini]|uniref:Ribonuclease J n=1 Tax=Convivina intestini TaxID=1505726 RepID=A0A2U1DC59_9LACO|nr:ribonuclease J [Convivina intestini]PVY85250.1 ribonuclease J [Convivina intestini]CAH1852597.1 Ribonuclease J 2 [Convivina intestini]SDB87192.1 ribonuclease J [Leuconostocaceae bacterium R-53105]
MTNLSIIPFGGVRENGKNMYAVTVHDKIFILDAGLKYPESEQLGIDVVIPDFEYLLNHQDQIAGIFLSHGHADAIGALPYFLQQVNVPIFGSKMTMALAKLAIQDTKELADYDDYHIVNAKTEIDFNDVKVSFFNTTHSIPESMGIVLETEYGQVVYTGDFKFDQTAEPAYQTDYRRLVEIGSKPVLALLGDAAGTEDSGPTASEREIHQYVHDTFVENKGKRIIVAAVASNIQRIQQVIDATAATKRRLILSGNDIESVVKTALELGKLHLPIPQNQLFTNIKNMSKVPAEQTVILETGRMGEPIKHLNRMASGEDRHINIGDGDFVFITTTPAFAMESYVAHTRNMLFQRGADVKLISSDLRSSGHASYDDLQLMLNFIRPQYFIPVQGEYRVMVTAQQAAEGVKIPADHILMAQKGDQYQWNNGQFVLEGSFTVGDTMIDGSGVSDIGNLVLRDRRILSEDGVFVSVVTIDRKKRKVVSKPKLTSRGFVFVKANRDLMKEASNITVERIEDYLANVKDFDWNELKGSVREGLSRYLFNETRRRPMIMPVVMEVNQNRRPKHKTSANNKKNTHPNKKNNNPKKVAVKKDHQENKETAPQ